MEKAHILLVEDNEGDIVLTQEAFEDCSVEVRFSVVKNGSDAVDFVFNNGDFEHAERPNLILLDINLPKKNGHEVLEILKTHEHSKRIPIIIFTTSAAKKDILRAYENHANSYIVKPLENNDFVKAISNIEAFWLDTVKLSE